MRMKGPDSLYISNRGLPDVNQRSSLEIQCGVRKVQPGPIANEI